MFLCGAIERYGLLEETAAGVQGFLSYRQREDVPEIRGEVLSVISSMNDAGVSVTVFYP